MIINLSKHTNPYLGKDVVLPASKPAATHLGWTVQEAKGGDLIRLSDINGPFDPKKDVSQFYINDRQGLKPGEKVVCWGTWVGTVICRSDGNMFVDCASCHIELDFGKLWSNDDYECWYCTMLICGNLSRTTIEH